MPKISFYLARPLSTTYTTIIMGFYCRDGQLKYYTGESIRPKDWDQEAHTTHKKGIRAALERLKGFVDHAIEESQVAGRTLTKSYLKATLDRLVKEHSENIEAGNNEPAFKDACEITFSKMETGEILTPDEKKYSAGSIKSFRFTAGFIDKFSPGIKASAVTMETYRRFITWCHTQDYSTNYIGSQIKNWKTLAKHAGFTLPGDFKKIVEETYDIYLDETEIEAMYRLLLPDNLALYRDWFIIGCYTGLRVSDLTLLHARNLSSGFITIANEKTDTKVVIPVHKYVKEILTKYKGFPPPITSQDLNREIKKIAKKAKIESDVLFTITKGGKRQDNYLKKWQLVSSHTARRAFITNLRMRTGQDRLPDSIILKLTGLRSLQTLSRYDKITADEAAKIAAGMEFFK
jgi:integrase